MKTDDQITDYQIICEALGLKYLTESINEVTYREDITAARCTMDGANFFFLIMERGPEHLKDKKGKKLWNEFWCGRKGFTGSERPLWWLEYINPPVMFKELAAFLREERSNNA